MKQLTYSALSGEAPPCATGRRREVPPTSVLDLFQGRVAARPEAVALVSGGVEVTYRELDRAAELRAAELAGRGARRGSVVGVVTGRSPEALVAMLAVWKAGGIHLPLDPAAPLDRIFAALAECRAAAVLTETRFAPMLRGGPPLVCLDGPNPGAAAVPAGPGRDGGAYIVYAAGPDGVPRGVRAGQRSLVNVLLELGGAMECGPDTRWIAMAPVGTDVSVAEFCLPLMSGALLVLPGEDELRDAGALVELVREHRVNRMRAVPAQWRTLLDAGFDAPRMVAMSGGEVLTPGLARQVRARVRGLLTGYGAAETTLLSTVWHVPPDPADVAIGRPIANTRLYLLDDSRRPVPAGEPGELYVAGSGVALGYVSGANPERFVADPHGLPGSVMYRTGELCRWRPDGVLAPAVRAEG